jgi:outer membrane protein OmpA-like peptidoglycan-associated protein
VRLAANPTSAQLGFHASSAPPLNAEVAQWVPGPILNHYRRAAAVAGVAGASTGAPGTPASMIAAMNGGVAPAEIIYFPDNTASLSAKAREQVREAAEAFKAHGGTGSVRVVGHASSRTANMPLQQHMDVIFRMSQQRANAVAQALIQAGVPAAKVQVEAVGDSQPVYYESMPKGEAGNRRAEIFLAG